jgi:antitoxin ParD1/3/4
MDPRNARLAVMRTTQSLSITLPLDMARMVKSKVASGEYASESEVIRDGLRALSARDAAVERWLREEVVPTHDEVMRDPDGETVSLDEVMTDIRARHAAREAKVRT